MEVTSAAALQYRTVKSALLPSMISPASESSLGASALTVAWHVEWGPRILSVGVMIRDDRVLLDLDLDIQQFDLH